jgi:hypothetical protein
MTHTPAGRRCRKTSIILEYVNRRNGGSSSWTCFSSNPLSLGSGCKFLLQGEWPVPTYRPREHQKPEPSPGCQHQLLNADQQHQPELHQQPHNWPNKKAKWKMLVYRSTDHLNRSKCTAIDAGRSRVDPCATQDQLQLETAGSAGTHPGFTTSVSHGPPLSTYYYS